MLFQTHNQVCSDKSNLQEKEKYHKLFQEVPIGWEKTHKNLCTVDRNCIGIKTTTPLFVQFTVKRVECEKKNTVNKRNLRNNGPLDLEYEFDGFTQENHRRGVNPHYFRRKKYLFRQNTFPICTVN